MQLQYVLEPANELCSQDLIYKGPTYNDMLPWSTPHSQKERNKSGARLQMFCDWGWGL